ncbi:monooxygenase [Apiospora arundinis]|uniref:Monooxygenase n=1 Tax=Apiospora arundinis TaxID=335852 RepID=A0ABR2I2W1_9PEZI
MSTEDSPKPFRAIVVGGGLVGLTAAHILTKAGIDFVVLEKHKSIFTSRGTQLALWPQTFRIFDQLGLLESVQSILDWCQRTFVLSAEDASIRMGDPTFEIMEKQHGYSVKFTQRYEMIKFLFESLPESAKPRILLGKGVENITSSEDGVTVVCEDGTSHEGSIVIGADGVHSRTRLLMRAMQASVSPEELPEEFKSPFTASYRLYFGDIPILPGLSPNTKYDATHDGMTSQIVYGTDRGAFGIYEKLDKPTSTTKRYTEADKEEVLKRWGKLYVAPGRTVSDVDSFRLGDAGLINLEEGVIDDWHWKRTVLVGDAVRKLEPHAGLGYNCGVTDVVVLVNKLRKLLHINGNDDNKKTSSAHPSTQILEDLFKSYHAERADDTHALSDTSMKAIRMLAWPDWKYRMLAKYALPYIPLTSLVAKSVIGPLVAATPVLEWLKEGVLPAPSIPWKHHPML